MIDVSGAFDGWLQDITVRREAAGTRNAGTGAWVPGAETNIPISAVVQDASPDDLLVIPEGERTEYSIKIHTVEILKTASEDGKTSADKVEYEGELYKVLKVFKRKTLGNYYKAIAVRIETL
jgi:hypothetical protein